MNVIDRREFLKASLLSGAALSLASSNRTQAASNSGGSAASPGIIDTNINLFQWPFRKLKYSETSELVFEALFHKNIAGVNERLAAECRAKGSGFLRPFGAVNLAWPDWEDDVRRCHEELKMPGLRLYPEYQSYDLTHPGMKTLLAMVRERGLLLQIVFGMEDPRVYHPNITVGNIDATPLVALLKAEPAAKVQLLHFTGNVRGTDLNNLVKETKVTIDISRWEGNGAVGRMIGTAPESRTVKIPVERVVFGSHAPYFPVETALLKLVESPASAEQLHAIMQGNARRVLAKA
jgi:uncharacterized protein